MSWYQNKVSSFIYSGSLSLENSPDWVIFAYQAGTLFFDFNGKLFLRGIEKSTPIEIGDSIVKDPQGVITVRKLVNNGGITR